jgi:methionine synthase II (cobalamin-independent)
VGAERGPAVGLDPGLAEPDDLRDRGLEVVVAGPESVIAGADCGFGSRIHPELGWAKLAVLAEGAALASDRIWRR